MGRLLSNARIVAAVIVATLPARAHADEEDATAHDTWFEVEVEVEVEVEREPEPEPVSNPYDEGEEVVIPPRRAAALTLSDYEGGAEALAQDPGKTQEQLAEEAAARLVDEAASAFAVGGVIAFIGTLSLFVVVGSDAAAGGLDLRGEGNSDLLPGYLGASIILVAGHVVALPPLTILLRAKEKEKAWAHFGPSGVGVSGSF